MIDPAVPVPPASARQAHDDNAGLIRTHFAMVKSTQKWGVTLLALGALQLIASNLLEPTFGILLLIVGGMSFLYIHPAMFVVYATTLTWAGVSNALGALTGGQSMWGVFGLVQFYLAYTTVREYLMYRRNERAYEDMLQAEGVAEEKRRAPLEAIPIGGCALAVTGALLLVAGFAVLVVLSIQEVTPAPEYVNWLLGLAQGFAVLAVGLSAASLASRFRYRILSILALAGSALTVLVFIVLTLA